MCLNTSFITGRGAGYQSIRLTAFIFHAITGADNTGSLPGKGKVSCWKAFLEADDSIWNADWLNLVERSNLVLASKIELMVWKKDTEPNHVLPSPSDYGWAMENAEWVPVMTTLSPAPEAVIELVKCGCSKEGMCNQSMPRELGYCA